MKVRYLRGLAVLATTALVFSGGYALAKPATSHAKPGKSQALSIKWKAGKDSTFAGTRFDGEYDATNNRVYFLGFRTTGDATDGEVWYYDVKTKKYVDTGVAMTTPVSNYHIAALTDGTGFGLYIFGGRDANATIVTDTQVYYPDTNTVAVDTKDPWPGKTPSKCISLPATGVAVVNNEAIVVGGLSFSGNGCVDDNSAQTWVYNPALKAGKRWKHGPDLNVARGYITPVVFNGTVYAIGGDVNDQANLVPQATVEKWTPFTGTWDDASVADLPEACDESQAFSFTAGLLANDLVLAGCGQWPNALADTLIYDTTSDTWSIAGALTNIRRNQAGALIPQGKKQAIFILGGYGIDSGFVDPIVSLELGSPTTKGPVRPARAPYGPQRPAPLF